MGSLPAMQPLMNDAAPARWNSWLAAGRGLREGATRNQRNGGQPEARGANRLHSIPPESVRIVAVRGVAK
jgi:hypothetical protein